MSSSTFPPKVRYPKVAAPVSRVDNGVKEFPCDTQGSEQGSQINSTRVEEGKLTLPHP